MKKRNNYRGKVFVLSSPSGAGKTTLIDKVRPLFPMLEESISCTTRAPRPGEIDGEDYFFLTQEDFRKKIEENYFLEWAKVHDNYYGTPKEYIEKKLETSSFIICDIDFQGALNMKRIFTEETVLIYIFPPTMKILEERLKSRNSDSPESISVRLENALKEIAFWPDYHYTIINDDLTNTSSLLENVLKAEIFASPAWNREFLKEHFPVQ